MPKELDDRFGPSPSSSPRKEPAPRRPNFRLRVIPGTILLVIGAPWTLGGIVAICGTSYELFVVEDDPYIDARYIAWRLMPMVFSWTTGISVLVSGICCWRGNWRALLIALATAGISVLLAIAAEHLLNPYSFWW